jgi:hypothetical protein
MALCHWHPRIVGDGAATQRLIFGEHRELCLDGPAIILLFHTEELDTLVYFDVVLALDLGGLELVGTH